MREKASMAEFRELYDRQINRVYRLALLLLGSVADAEDVAQTVFLKIWEKNPKFRDADHETAWVLTTTRNQCRDLQKSYYRKHRTAIEDAPEKAVSFVSDADNEIWQALDCNYFNADTVMTHVMMQDNLLYIYNEYKEKNPTEAYTYDLTQVGQEQALNCVEDPAEIAKIQKNWMAFAKEHCKDTFDTVPAAQTDWNGSDTLRYSKECITWTDAQGIEWNSSLLTYDDGTYKLYTYAVNEPTDVKTEVLNLSVSEDATQQDELPAFAYTGDDTILKTICDYMCSEDQGYDTEDGVYIPAPVIYATATRGDEITVFANLWSFVYKQNGNTLDCEAGGSQPSRLKLQSDGNGGYTIKEHLIAGDGEEYVKDIKEFCKGYQVSPEKFMQSGNNSEEIRKALVKMYVDNNQLDIKYIKDYGWDPIPLDDTQES